MQNKQHQATIKQHLKEIARLNDEIKILKDTNGFLSDQIAFLNQQLADVTSNKENNEEENKSTTTTASSGGVDSSYARNLARSNLAKKLYASGGSEYSASPRPLDTNRIVAPDDEAPTSETAATSVPTKDPGASLSPKKNLLESRLEETPMTPSTLAKQNHCKQQ